MKKTVGMMGLKGVPGLNIVSSLDKSSHRGNQMASGKQNVPKHQNPLVEQNPPIKHSFPNKPNAGRTGKNKNSSSLVRIYDRASSSKFKCDPQAQGPRC